MIYFRLHYAQILIHNTCFVKMKEMGFVDFFWKESVWLPPNMTWKVTFIYLTNSFIWRVVKSRYWNFNGSKVNSLVNLLGSSGGGKGLLRTSDNFANFCPMYQNFWKVFNLGSSEIRIKFYLFRHILDKTFIS